MIIKKEIEQLVYLIYQYCEDNSIETDIHYNIDEQLVELDFLQFEQKKDNKGKSNSA